MLGIFLLTVFIIVVLVLSLAAAADKWKSFRRTHLNYWLSKVETGLCERTSWRYGEIASDSDEIKCRVQSTPLTLFLAKRTQCRIVKYNGSFFTEMKTWGSEWVELNKRNVGTFNKTNRYDSVEQAEAVVAQTVADIQHWLENSVPEDPNRFKRIVVSQQTVTTKEPS